MACDMYPLWLESIPGPAVWRSQVTAALQFRSCAARPAPLGHSSQPVCEGCKPISPCSFTVPTTAAPSHLPPPLAPPPCLLFSSSFPSHNKYTFSRLSRIFWMVESLLAERSCSPPGKRRRSWRRRGVIVVMTSLPFSRTGLWGSKRGSVRGRPSLCATERPGFTATVLPWSEWHCLGNTGSFFHSAGECFVSSLCGDSDSVMTGISLWWRTQWQLSASRSVNPLGELRKLFYRPRLSLREWTCSAPFGWNFSNAGCFFFFLHSPK